MALALLLAAGCDRSAPAATPPVSAAPAPAEPAPAPAGRTVIWIGGDVLLSGAMRRSVRTDGDAAAGFAAVLSQLAQLWREDPGSFVLVNLESPVARQRRESDSFLHLKTGPARVPAPLNAPPWLLDGLRRAGVDAVMLANNHALDQDRAGLEETLAAARRAGLITTGAGCAPSLRWPIVIGEDGARTAILSYFEKDYPEPDLIDGEAGLSVLGPDSMEHVRAAARDNDAVVVVVHVVAELLTEPKPAWRAWARELAEAGADAVAIHGTHVPGPVETLDLGDRRAVIAYGLGNFVSDMGAAASPGHADRAGSGKWEIPETREALMMRVEVSASEVEVTFLPLWMGNDRYLVHNRVIESPVRFELLPLFACGPAASLPEGWPDPWRGELVRWIGERRDHLLEASGLADAACVEGRLRLLPAPPIHGMM